VLQKRIVCPWLNSGKRSAVFINSIAVRFKIITDIIFSRATCQKVEKLYWSKKTSFKKFNSCDVSLIELEFPIAASYFTISTATKYV